MRQENPSQLGPWQDPHAPYQKTNVSTFKQQLILPRVTQFKPYIIKLRDQKQQKSSKPLALKQMQLQLKTNNNKDVSSQDQHKQQRNSKTLSFDMPKIGGFNKSFVNETPKRECNNEIIEYSAKRQVSKVDLLADYINNGEKDKETIQGKQQKWGKQRQKQFSKKRSLMQVVKYLKSSSIPLQRYEQNDKTPKNIGRYYDQYRSILNLSLQQSSYIPSFEARKSLHSYRKR